MAQQPVRLKYVESVIFSPGGSSTGVNITAVKAKVKNVGSRKDVALHHVQANGTWAEKTLTLQKNFDTYDLFALNDSTFVITDFVLRYSVEGQTFWDNNDGANYHVDELKPNSVGGNVVLNKATARQGSEAGGGFTIATSWVEGEIFVKNLSFNKRVGIRLSANGWASFQDTGALFSGNVAVAEGLSQVEVWKFKTPELNLDISHPHFNFAVFYNDVDTGEWYWDNNFDQDYTLRKMELATDE